MPAIVQELYGLETDRLQATITWSTMFEEEETP